MEGSLGKGGVISKFGVKSILAKFQTLAAMGIRAEMQFLACCVSLGISVLRMRVLNFVLCTSYNRVIFGARAVQQLPISLVCVLNLLWPFPGLYLPTFVILSTSYCFKVVALDA